MYRKKVEQLRELQDELKEISAQCDELEYETDELLEAVETEVKFLACQPAKLRSTARTRSPPQVCSKHRQVK